MSQSVNGGTASEDDSAVDTSAAADAELIREGLPKDVCERLTDAAFAPGAVRELLRDCYYMGPISVGSGGWHGAYGNGQPGTGLRRPNGALYNYPRSWRASALRRALETGLLTHAGDGRFVTTERGAAVLRRVDRCPEHLMQREPAVETTRYVGNPNTEGHLESHALVTRCPFCEETGYDYSGSTTRGYSKFERDEEALEWAVAAISDVPEARTFGGEREIRDEAADQTPIVDAEHVETVVNTHVENHTPPNPREFADPHDEGLFGRQVVTVPSQGEHYHYEGTDEAVVVKRSGEQGDIHIVPDPDGEDGRLKVEMGYETAVERGVKDRLHPEAEGAEWNGDYWTVEANRIGRVLSKLTFATYPPEVNRWECDGNVFPDADEQVPEEAEYLDVTVSPAAMRAVEVAVPGVDASGDLAE
ncbi:MAG: hypothetical protein ACI9CA_000027 [Natronomonas sp.]|jgi:hypothetical protein